MTSRAAPTNVISNQLSFSYCITLKENRQALFVLRHQRRLPSTSASLIKEIRQSVFVLARVPSELDHDSLVFFHRGLEIMGRYTSTVLVAGFLNQNDRAR